jgi:hypothetical protein
VRLPRFQNKFQQAVQACSGIGNWPGTQISTWQYFQSHNASLHWHLPTVIRAAPFLLTLRNYAKFHQFLSQGKRFSRLIARCVA